MAAPKQKIAVLGLEVQTTTVDPQDSQVAQTFTRELRVRAKDPTGVFQLAPGSERELIDEKLMNECSSDTAACLGKIGTGLGADQVLWGKVEKSAGDYKITLKILNVNSKTVDVWGPRVISVKAAKATELTDLARNGYDSLTGANTGGTLVIKSNAKTGKVWINDEEKGQLAGGTLTVTLPENRYKVIIVADGFRKYESDTLTIRGGQTQTLETELSSLELGHERGGTVSQSSTHTGSKVLAGVSIGVAAVAGGLAIWQYTESKKYQDGGAQATVEMDAGEVADSGDCGKEVVGAGADEFEKSCDAQERAQYLSVAAGIGAAAGILFVYLATRGGDETQRSNATSARRTKRKPAFAVTPILSPDGGGATVRFDW